jgi:NAD(P)-dependent dehydrogenase (short-subunit alcohol dehydrogenase family)
MQRIVITGSTRGIGFALAGSFLDLGCSVAVSGRTQEHVDRAVESLIQRHGSDRVSGSVCDVRDPTQVQALWDRAAAWLGSVDVWINNAGLSNQEMNSWAVPAAQVRQVIETNLLGVIYGSQVAAKGMLAQGHGSIYNMEGMGGDGSMREGLIPYGTSKAGVHYWTQGLARETRGTPLIVGSFRPGMLATEMVTSQYANRPEEWARARRILNIIADRPETVAPWLARRALENKRSGVCLAYLTRWRLLWRFMLAPFVGRDVFAAELAGAPAHEQEREPGAGNP